MELHVHSETNNPIIQPWNKDKLTGAKPPLRLKHVWAVRTRLQLLQRFRDLALFNLAIDSKLRGCDVVGLRIAEVAPNGYAVDRASVRQRKTGRSVRFEIMEQTRQAIDDHLAQGSDPSSPYLFPGRGAPQSGLSMLIFLINARRSDSICGRPPREPDFQRQ
jgi:integrase